MTTTKIKVCPNDVFDFVVGNTAYDPIEKCIDPMRYEVMNSFIYDRQLRIQLNQSKEYATFCEGVFNLKLYAPNMSRSEIQKVSDELAEIAPTELNL